MLLLTKDILRIIRAWLSHSCLHVHANRLGFLIFSRLDLWPFTCTISISLLIPLWFLFDYLAYGNAGTIQYNLATENLLRIWGIGKLLDWVLLHQAKLSRHVWHLNIIVPIFRRSFRLSIWDHGHPMFHTEFWKIYEEAIDGEWAGIHTVIIFALILRGFLHHRRLKAIG